MAGNPWDKFFWSDYDSDKGLDMCSLAAQGLWMRMLCIMAEAEPKGHLVIGKVQLSEADLARKVRVPVETVKDLLAELEQYGVFSRAGRAQTIINRRMAKAAKISAARSNAAHKSWEHRQNDAPDSPNDSNRFDDLHMQTASKPDASSNANAMQTPGTVPEAISQKLEAKLASLPSDSVAPRAGGTLPPPSGSASVVAAIPVADPSFQAEPEPEEPVVLTRNKMPRLSDPPSKWCIPELTTQMSRDDNGTSRPTVCGFHIDILARQICEAAAMDRPNWRGDWWTVANWLHSGFGSDHILGAIKERRARFGQRWRPPDALIAFDSCVREYQPKRSAA